MPQNSDAGIPARVYLSPRLVLRPLDCGEADRFSRFLRRNRTHFEPWGPSRDDLFYSPETTARRIEAEVRERCAGRALPLALFSRRDGALIGTATLSAIVRGPFQSAFLGYKLAHAAQGQGLMTEAIRRIVGIAFDDLGLHRVEANVMPRNNRSIRLLRRCDFHEEGRSPEYLYINGVWEDHLHFARLNRGWVAR